MTVRKSAYLLSDLQDKLDLPKITLDEYYDRWVAEMAENKLLYPRDDRR